MPRALFTLIRLRWKAALRNLVRGLKTTRGKVFGIIGLVMFVLWMLPMVISLFAPIGHANPEHVRMAAPLGLLVFCLLNLFRGSNQNAILFTPAEVDFLFPGPFTRRHLLLYKVAGTLLGTVIGAAFFSIMLRRTGSLFIAVYLATFLGLSFLNLLSMNIAILAQVANERAFNLTRRAILAVIGMAAVFAVMKAMNSVHATTGEELWALVTQIQTSAIGRIVLAPFNVFGELLAAESMQVALLQAGIAMMIDGLLLYVLLRLDANYMEASLNTSQRIYDKVRRMQARGGIGGFATASNSRLRLPQLPYMQGAGPLMWRQSLNAIRSSKGLFIILLMVLASVGLMKLLSKSSGQGPPLEAIAGPMVGMLVFLLPQMVRFDFRGDLDHVDWLKSLPISWKSMSIGQLAAPVMVLSILEWALLAGYAMIKPERQDIALDIAILVMPANALLIAIENLFFLWYPSRRSMTPGLDFQAIGRNMVLMIGKLAAMGVAGGATTLVALAAVWLFDASVSAALTCGAVALMLISLGFVPVIASAIARFDPALEVPAS